MESDLLSRRARKYSYWSKMRSVLNPFSKLFKLLWAVCSVLVITGIVLRFGFSIDPSQYIAIVLAPFVITTVLFLDILNEIAKSKMEKYTDPRFGTREYAYMLDSVRSAGITNPTQYIIDHPDHVDAYKRVLKAARYVVESPLDCDWKDGATSLIFEEHRVAALVLPGEEELVREERIISLLKDRGISQYTAIKEFVDQNNGQPLPLQDGAL